jgi:hypothetical protein
MSAVVLVGVQDTSRAAVHLVLVVSEGVHRCTPHQMVVSVFDKMEYSHTTSFASETKEMKLQK